MGPKNACSYADIVTRDIDRQVLAAMSNFSELQCWFRDGTFVLCRGTVERLQVFFQLLNTFDPMENLQWKLVALLCSFEIYPSPWSSLVWFQLYIVNPLMHTSR